MIKTHGKLSTQLSSFFFNPMAMASKIDFNDDAILVS